jgi:hypothetical protein
VGGNIFNAGGLRVRNIARYNHVTDEWTALGSGPEFTVRSFLQRSNGAIVVAEAIAMLPGTGSRVSEFDWNTSTWTTLGVASNPYLAPAARMPVIELANGDIVIGGNMTVMQGLPVQNIARFDPAAGLWRNFEFGTNAPIDCLARMLDGRVAVGGEFTSAAGQPAHSIVRCGIADNRWTRLGPRVDGSVETIAVMPTGDIAVAGTIWSVGDSMLSFAFGMFTPRPCCNAIDFNNNGAFPEDQDVIDFFNVLAGGSCG